MASWQEYTALARHLDHLGREAGEATSGHARRRDALGAAVAQLDQRLAAQQQRLAHLGRAIGQHFPSTPVPPRSEVDPGQAVQLATQAADSADRAATEAERLAQRAPLLPNLSPLARNVVVYLSCALVTVILQFGLLVASGEDRIDTWTLLAWMCAGLPAMAFFAGYLVIAVWGKPRMVAVASTRSPRLGFAICFLAMPIVYCGYKLFTSFL